MVSTDEFAVTSVDGYTVGFFVTDQDTGTVLIEVGTPSEYDFYISIPQVVVDWLNSTNSFFTAQFVAGLAAHTVELYLDE